MKIIQTSKSEEERLAMYENTKPFAFTSSARSLVIIIFAISKP